MCIDLPDDAANETLSAAGIGFSGCDITDEQALDAAVHATLDKIGIPQVIVNCAGIAPAARTVSKQGPPHRRAVCKGCGGKSDGLLSCGVAFLLRIW